jgi:hypothetical protein
MRMTTSQVLSFRVWDLPTRPTDATNAGLSRHLPRVSYARAPKILSTVVSR